MITIRDHGDGGKWYVVAAHYPTRLMAKRAWERAEAKLMPGSGEDVGLTRLGPNLGNPNAISTGAPDGVHPVVVVTLREEAAHKAERLLHDGTGWEPDVGFCDALILRRARIMQEMAGQTGRLIIRRPDEHGARLDQEGNLTETAGGAG